MRGTDQRNDSEAVVGRLAALNPKIAVADHKKPGAPDIITATGQYLTDLGRIQQETGGDQELYDAMTELYPDRVSNQAWLMFGFQQAYGSAWGKSPTALPRSRSSSPGVCRPRPAR